MKKLILILVIFQSFHLQGQQADLGSWNILNIKYNHNEKLSFFSEQQLRSLKFYNHYHYHEVKGGINYRIFESVSLTLGIGNYQTYAEGGTFITPKNNNELRIWPQLTLTQKVNHLKIEQRYRTEMRWTSNGYRNRFRYRLGIQYPIGKNKKSEKPFLIGMSNELFFTNNEPFFERNRIQLTLSHKFHKQFMVQLGYLHQFDYKINDETGRDFLVVGLYFELFHSKNDKSY